MKFFPIKKALPLFVLSTALLQATAQNRSDAKKSGDYYFVEGNYASAAYYYRQLVESDFEKKKATFFPQSVSLLKKRSKKNAEASSLQTIYRLAESYRMINDYQNAEKFYAQVVQSKSPGFADAAYWYGVALRANGKYEEARAALNQYKQETSGGLYLAAAERELQNLHFIQEQAAKNKSHVTVSKAADGINTPEANYAAAWTVDGFLFTSTRPDSMKQNSRQEAAANHLYLHKENGNVEKIELPLGAATERGAACLSPDGERLYFTQWTTVKSGTVSAIYVSQKVGSTWSEPVKLNANINIADASSKQPFVTADGAYLLFASNRSGGVGGYDIWAAPLNQNGEPGSAFNLGKAVNTTEDEEAPFYHNPSHTLVFASKGRVGMGGFDLFQSKGELPAQWSEAVNLGAPINSNKDDSYFWSRGSQLLKNAMLSSDRYSDYCLSLFNVSKPYKKIITGKVIDCETSQPLSNAAVQAEKLSSLQTDEKGNYLFEVEELKPFSIKASKEAYSDNIVQFSAPQDEEDTVYNAVICLKANKTTPVATVPKIAYFDFARYNLRPETKATLDTLVSLLQKESNRQLLITGYTDAFGSDGYNQQLAQQRADACKAYLVAAGIAESRIAVTAKGECCPLVPEQTTDGKDNAEGRQANRRVEFLLK